MNKSNCAIYIDEAGDLGVNRGTRWFVITGVIVKNEDEKDIRNRLVHLRSQFNVNEIHMRKIKNHSNLTHIVNVLNAGNFITINVIADTNLLTSKDSIRNYNYMCRLVLERASWYMSDNNLIGDVILSSRGTNRDNELINYIHNKLIGYSGNEIRGNVFGCCSAKQSSQWDLLQLADICATSFFKAYEKDKNGYLTPCFMSLLRTHIYSRNGKHYGYGLKYYDSNMKPYKSYFINYSPCKK